jgi:hypothetical protein
MKLQNTQQLIHISAPIMSLVKCAWPSNVPDATAPSAVAPVSACGFFPLPYNGERLVEKGG